MGDVLEVVGFSLYRFPDVEVWFFITQSSEGFGSQKDMERHGANHSWPTPKPPFPSNATGLSLATFFTLLAQRRLVTPTSSVEINNLLSTASWFAYLYPINCSKLPQRLEEAIIEIQYLISTRLD